MSRSGDAKRKSLRGERCKECGHSQAAHNSLGYCSRQSRLYGECPCPTGGWFVGVGSRPTWTPAQYAAARKSQARLVRAAQTGVDQ